MCNNQKGIHREGDQLLQTTESGAIETDEDILNIGPTSGVVEIKLKQIILDKKIISEAVKGDEVTFECSQRVRPHDMVYKVVSITS
ncbi:MAG: hypothetical protein NTX22_03485 [Ignavibacteriales bacterium]|nr:hypothetical protein [Ignavibacteriales bacterium]